MKSQTQVTTVMGRPITYGQTAQGAGMKFNPKTGQMESSKSKFNWGAAAQSLNEENKQKEEQNPNPEVMGGELPIAVKMPEFKKMPNYDDRIAKLLQAKRGY